MAGKRSLPWRRLRWNAFRCACNWSEAAWIWGHVTALTHTYTTIASSLWSKTKLILACVLIPILLACVLIQLMM
jgi:hypothetical protein